MAEAKKEIQIKEVLSDEIVKTVTFKIEKFDPEKDSKPHYAEYKVPVYRGMTVLDGLLYVKEDVDGTINFRYSCRMGICGSCGMFINGKPRMACMTQILELDSDVIEIAPLPNYDNIRDLVPDSTPLFEKHKKIKPYLIREDTKEQENPIGEYYQTPEEHEYYSQFSFCIKCGLCYAACPSVASDPEYLGPQALTQAYRYSVDTRDEGFVERVMVVDDPHGCWRCHYAGACSEVCPKGVDPAKAIQLLKGLILKYRLGLKKKRKGAGVIPAHPRPNIKKAPKRTVPQES